MYDTKYTLIDGSKMGRTTGKEEAQQGTRVSGEMVQEEEEGKGGGEAQYQDSGRLYLHNAHLNQYYSPSPSSFPLPTHPREPAVPPPLPRPDILVPSPSHQMAENINN